MAFDITEIKKLSDQEKRQIIDEISETMEQHSDDVDMFDEDPEVAAMLDERIAKYERGEEKSYSWEEAKEIFLHNLNETGKSE